MAEKHNSVLPYYEKDLGCTKLAQQREDQDCDQGIWLGAKEIRTDSYGHGTRILEKIIQLVMNKMLILAQDYCGELDTWRLNLAHPLLMQVFIKKLFIWKVYTSVGNCTNSMNSVVPTSHAW